MPARPSRQRAALLAVVVAAGLVALPIGLPGPTGAVQGAQPHATAAEPTADPGATPTATPGTTPTGEPGPEPSPTATGEPGPEPSPTASPTAEPTATASPVSPTPTPPTAGPGVTDGDPEPTATPEPTPTPNPTEPPAPPLSRDCAESADAVSRADALLRDAYQLGSWPVVTLPHDPTWAEDPYRDANWRFRYHSLRYVLDLVNAGLATGDARYTERALELTGDWVADNPRDAGPSDMSWNDHSTALRAVVLSCLADQLPWPEWLEDALVVHGETLADPDFYVRHGNHALNQSLGLLEVGRVLGQQGWVDLAVARIRRLIETSVDEQGVTNEQSIGYQDYNYRRYTVVRERLLAIGVEPGPAFERVARMPEMMAYGTLPWGSYELIGDTTDGPVAGVPGTWAEYAATAGRSGPKPPTRTRLFTAGYLFVRSGWGEERPFRRETALTVKWGPAAFIHGHHDGGSLTLAAWGSRLLVDPGLYRYQGGAYRAFFQGRSAHNVVTVDGTRWLTKAPTRLVGVSTSSRHVDLRLRIEGIDGVTHRRRITYSRRLDLLVVEDRLSAPTARTMRQLWHLTRDARPTLGATTVRTRRERGNVLIRQLGTGAVTQRLVTGRTSPIQGWVSPTYASLYRAPVVEVVQRGANVRYVTLIVPARDRPNAEVLAFRQTTGGYVLRVRVGGRTERIVVDGSSVAITGG